MLIQTLQTLMRQHQISASVKPGTLQFFSGLGFKSRTTSIFLAIYCSCSFPHRDCLDVDPERRKVGQALHHGCTEFHLMAANGMETLINKMGKKGIRALDIPNYDGIPGLHFATAFAFPDHESPITIREVLQPLLRGLLRIRVNPGHHSDYQLPDYLRDGMFESREAMYRALHLLR